MQGSIYDGIAMVIRMSTNEPTSCPVCRKVALGDTMNFDSGINHLIEAHKGRVLHVGGETVEDNSGKPWQTTVAVVGIPQDPLAGAI